MLVGSVDVNLLHNGERNAVVLGAEGLDIVWRSRLLSPKLVYVATKLMVILNLRRRSSGKRQRTAREPNNDKALVLVFLVDFLEARQLRSKSTSRRLIDHESNLCLFERGQWEANRWRTRGALTSGAQQTLPFKLATSKSFPRMSLTLKSKKWVGVTMVEVWGCEDETEE